jgi:hypothetical protein
MFSAKGFVGPRNRAKSVAGKVIGLKAGLRNLFLSLYNIWSNSKIKIDNEEK